MIVRVTYKPSVKKKGFQTISSLMCSIWVLVTPKKTCKKIVGWETSPGPVKVADLEKCGIACSQDIKIYM